MQPERATGYSGPAPMSRRPLPLTTHTLSAATMVAAMAVGTGCPSTANDGDLFGSAGQTGIGATDDGANAEGDGPTDGASDGGADGNGDGDDGDDGDDDGVKLDVGTPGNGSADDGGTAVGCDKVDFLFVIDNSGSMQDEQQSLIASFPGFMSTIQDTLQAQDYQVMVVDTDGDGGGGGSSLTCINGVCSCSPAPACCDLVCSMSDECNGFPCDALPGGECDGTIGAGKIYRQDGTLCLSEDGPRFMNDQTANLTADFACAAQVGTFGSGNEIPMQSMLEAVSEPMKQPGACNEGFLRDDAILVVTFITDEEDFEKSPGDPPQWHDGLVAAKGGNEDAIVVLGLFGDHDQPGAGCTNADEAEPSPRLRAFVESFGGRGFVGSVCAADYSPFFADAVEIIDVTCDEFEPEG